MAKKSWNWDKHKDWNQHQDYTSCATWGCKGWTTDSNWKPGLQCHHCKAIFKKPQSIRKIETESASSSSASGQWSQASGG
eukprot:8481946-Pyramimonas_sp.AAC.1